MFTIRELMSRFFISYRKGKTTSTSTHSLKFLNNIRYCFGEKKQREVYIMLLPVFFLLSQGVKGQSIENQFQLRAATEFSKKVVKKVYVSFTPELRWNDAMSFDRYLLTGGLEYKPYKFLKLYGNYRFVGDKKSDGKTEYFHRFQLGSELSDKINRWETGARLNCTNYTDDEGSDMFFRYKVFTSYNIRKSKITPQASFEVFHQLDKNIIYKYRSSVGFDYKLKKKISVGVDYRFDYYKTKNKNRHIVDLELKIRL